MLNKRQKAATKSRTNQHALPEKPIAMTLKLDRDTYRRLAALGATGNSLRTHQEIMLTALKEYLDRNKA